MQAVISFSVPARAQMQAGDERVSEAEREQAAAAIHEAMFNPDTGSYWRMPVEDQVKIGYHDGRGRWHWGTVIDVVDYPSAADLALVGVTVNPETGRRDRLLGLFTAELDADGNLVEDPNHPPVITNYLGECRAAGYSIIDVNNHETGHRLRYNDEHLPGPPISDTYVPSLPPDNPCDGCASDEWLATSERALYALRERSHMRHRIPEGLAGRIPEVRARLERAQAAVDRFERLPQVSDRHGEFRQLRALITATQVALEGDSLDPQDISRAHGFAHRAWDANTDLAEAYQLGLKAQG